MRPSLAILVILPALGGCVQPVDCTLVDVPPIAVLPVDGATDLPVADSTAVTATRDGTVWTFTPFRSNPAGQLVGLWGGSGPGTYHLRAAHPRFLRWDSVVLATAPGNACGGFPVEFPIRLVRP